MVISCMKSEFVLVVLKQPSNAFCCLSINVWTFSASRAGRFCYKIFCYLLTQILFTKKLMNYMLGIHVCLGYTLGKAKW